MITITEPNDYLCEPTLTIGEALARINALSPHLFQVVIDSDRRVLGTVTDGDMRRAILAGKDLSLPVSEAMHAPPILGLQGEDEKNIDRLRGAKFLPIVDEDSRLQVILLDVAEIQPITRALVMAGGFGRRLGERTQSTPKPLLHVGERPVLDRVLNQLEDAGITSIDIAVHYLASQVEEFIHARDNKSEIRLIHEDQPMGTVGAVSLLPTQQAGPLLIVNGDVICRVDFGALTDFHMRHGNDGTIAVAQYEVSVPYGIVKCSVEGEFTGIQEKPVFNHFVAAGIYCLSPAYLALVPDGKPMDMPELLAKGRQVGLRAGLFPIHEYWKDIGQPIDLHEAEADHAPGTGTAKTR